MNQTERNALSLLAYVVTAALPHRLLHVPLGAYLTDLWMAVSEAHAYLAENREALADLLGDPMGANTVKALQLDELPNAEGLVPEEVQDALEDIKAKGMTVEEAESTHWFGSGMDA